MDRRVKLKVLGITFSQVREGAYALILVEEEGTRRIPIVVGAPEAQSIIIRMEKLTIPRPLTHDLLLNMGQAFDIELLEVFISRFEDGIFYSTLLFRQSDRVEEVDSRTSDAIALAVRAEVPIYTTPQIVAEAGFLVEDVLDEEEKEEHEATTKEETTAHTQQQPDPTQLSREELETLLQEAIEREAYELASQLQEELNQRQSE